MVTVAAVQIGNYVGRGKEYVHKLFDACRKWVPDARYVLLTDDPATAPDYASVVTIPPGLNGWWNKLLLFHPGMFPKGERVLYFDLDTLIVGDISNIAAYDGPFAILRDTFTKGGLQSAVMAWEAGTVDYIWTMWEEAGRPVLAGGDQSWIEFIVRERTILDDEFPTQIVSFKRDCFLRGGIPSLARVCLFHGQPRPHDAALVLPWIDEIWNQPTSGDY